MRVSVLLFAFIIANAGSLFAQKKQNCDLIEAILKNDKLKEIFYFNRHTEVPIVFIDTKASFSGCEIGTYFNRKVLFILDSSRIDSVNYSNIIIEGFVKTATGFKVALYYKIRQAYFSIYLKRKDSIYTVSKIEGGYF